MTKDGFQRINRLSTNGQRNLVGVFNVTRIVKTRFSSKVVAKSRSEQTAHLRRSSRLSRPPSVAFSAYCFQLRVFQLFVRDRDNRSCVRCQSPRRYSSTLEENASYSSSIAIFNDFDRRRLTLLLRAMIGVFQLSLQLLAKSIVGRDALLQALTESSDLVQVIREKVCKVKSHC